MAYADYAYYTATYLGTAIAEADFPRLALRASDYIDYMTRAKAAKATEESVLDALSKACCAVAEHIQVEERNAAVAAGSAERAISGGSGELKSESVGGYSVSYTTGADYANANTAKAEADARRSILIRYLANTGLLYRGC